MLVKPHEYIDAAFKDGYALAALDVFDVATVRGVINAAQECSSPVILQYMQDVISHIGANTAYSLAASAAESVDVPIIIHLDHGRDRDIIQTCIEAGFTSVMVDASAEKYEENIEISRDVVRYAHERGVWVEAGLGPVYAIPEMALEADDMTDPKQVAQFVSETGVDALAIAVGTVHGSFTGQEYLRFELIEAIQQEIPTIPLVIHGASGVADKHIKKAVSSNVVKVSAGTELMNGYREATNAWLSSRRESLGMVQLLEGLEERVQLSATEKMKIMGSAGRV